MITNIPLAHSLFHRPVDRGATDITDSRCRLIAAVTALLAALCILLLTGCESGPYRPDQETGTELSTAEDDAVVLTQQQRIEQLLELAEDASSLEESQHYRLQAVGVYLEQGDIESARKLLDETAALSSDDPAGSTDIDIMYARLAVAADERQLAQQLINRIEPVTRQQQIDHYALKADLDYMFGRYVFVIDRRVQLETYLVDEEARRNNNMRIWAALSRIPDEQLASAQGLKPVVAGWMELARVVRDNQRNVEQLETALLDWGTRYPAHPANEGFLADLIEIYQGDAAQRKHIAVMLPLTGDLEAVSAAIRNGFMTAFYDSGTMIAPELRFYDSTGVDDIGELYTIAIAAGATDVVGPLDKSRIAELSQMASLPVPVLSLNYTESGEATADNLFQFGLSPEDEARQVAELAIGQDMTRAAVFYPDSDWGRRVKDAFNRYYHALGGSVQSEIDYATDTNDYRRPIRQLLNLDKSAIRRQRVENTIGEKTQSEPRRREDLDMIFLAATSRSARSIMPSFKFHHAGDLPVYSTSHVFTGIPDRDRDRDLDGLTFCDLPWILRSDDRLKASFERNWPRQQAYTRLFALGVDAYHLVYNLEYMRSLEGSIYPGQTGDITLGNDNRMRRELLWARFYRGLPEPFNPVLQPEETPQPTAQQQVADEQS